VIGFFLLNFSQKFIIALNAWQIYPDSIMYIEMAEYVAGLRPNEPGGGVWGGPYRTSILVLLLSSLLRCNFGLQAFSILEIFFNFSSCILTYYLATRFFGEETGILSSILLSLNWHYWWYSSSILVEVPASFTILLVLLSLDIASKSKSMMWWGLTGVALAFSVLMRVTNWMIILPIAIFLYQKIRKDPSYWSKAFLAFSVFLVFVMAFGLSIYHLYGKVLWESLIRRWLFLLGVGRIKERHYLGGDSATYVQSFPQLYYLFFAPFSYSLIGCLLAGVGLIDVLREKSDRERVITLLSWLLFFPLSFSLVGGWDERYSVYWAPAVFILMAHGLQIVRKANSRVFKVLLLFACISVYDAALIPFVDVTVNPPFLLFRNDIFGMRLGHSRVLRGIQNIVFLEALESVSWVLLGLQLTIVAILYLSTWSGQKSQASESPI
jgi:4-amino-4-deoxy-L-arabinose transferase-like glycosyltransferase